RRGRRGQGQGPAPVPRKEDGRDHEPGQERRAEDRADEERLRPHALQVLAAGHGKDALHAAAPCDVTSSMKMSWRLGSTISKRLSRSCAAAALRMDWGSLPSARRIST